ncbi:hypothetical protein ES692_16805 [Psychroserpens burtonensis]|uniref:Uncharacterized protein n=1 Tax=Psychroserpens burtonensis TaxID=49278 RepID=A0A5C7BBR0_9FLAO|nr:hypothetical protein [Psychroserpens burtonensis]TXE15394.1 hypothetical protein ES692_16805 [Psychroserpens burtonensis]
MLHLWVELSFYILIGCKSQENETKYYPTQSLNDEIIKLDLNTTSLDFREIKALVSRSILADRSVLVEIKDGRILKKIYPRIYTEMLQRNLLTITSDSILIDKGYPISELKWILIRHYTNNGKELRYPKSYDRAYVGISLELNETGEDLKKSLLNLTSVFDEVNLEVKDSLELHIYFDTFRHAPPPPTKPKS